MLPMTQSIHEDSNYQPFYRTEEKLPERNARVIVVCREFRCLGYLDDRGTWRRHYGEQPLEDVIGWMP